MIQVAQIIPQLEESEAALRKVCDQMMSSWERISDDGLLEEDDYYIPDTEAKLELFVSATLSWMDRVTKLKVGRDELQIQIMTISRWEINRGIRFTNSACC